jgi:hypothetical protein
LRSNSRISLAIAELIEIKLATTRGAIRMAKVLSATERKQNSFSNTPKGAHE